jgi:methanogenic corrinoid protein MtbC1
MADVVNLVKEKGLSDKIKVMIGGAPITDEYAAQIGADCYTPDAASAADAAVDFCKQ